MKKHLERNIKRYDKNIAKYIQELFTGRIKKDSKINELMKALSPFASEGKDFGKGTGCGKGQVDGYSGFSENSSFFLLHKYDDKVGTKKLNSLDSLQYGMGVGKGKANGVGYGIHKYDADKLLVELFCRCSVKYK